MWAGKPWMDSGRKENLPFDRHLIDIKLQPLLGWTLRKGSSGYENRILAPDRWCAYERSNFSGQRLLRLPIHRKMLISLTWDIWFSLINNNLLMFRLTCPLLQNFYITWLLSFPPWSSSLRVTWDFVSWAWSPKNSHWIKHSSQPLGCEYFLSQQGLKQWLHIRIPWEL